MKRRNAGTALLYCLAVLLPHMWAVPAAGHDAERAFEYQRPSEAIVRAVEAPERPLVFAGPRGERAALLTRAPMPSIAEVARPVLGLAGQVLDPANNGPGRGITFDTLRLVTFAGGEQMVALPEGMRISTVRWAPDGSALAFLAHRDDRVELWTVDAEDGALHLLAGSVNAGFAQPFEWLPDSSGLLVRMVPERRGAPPARPAVPTRPEIRETGASAAPVATLSNLLRNAHDDALFRHYFTAQLAIVPAAGGPPKPIGTPGIYHSMSVSPDGRYILVERLEEPFSRAFSASSFPADIVVLDRRGATVQVVHERPGSDAAPPAGGISQGPRSIAWRSDVPATLVWAEADGDADRLFSLSVPFAGPPREMGRVEGRYVRSYWANADLAVLAVRPAEGGQVELTFDPGAENGGIVEGTDLLAPGQRLLTEARAGGHEVLALSESGMPLVLDSGDGATPDRILAMNPASGEMRAALTLPAAAGQRIAEIVDPRRGHALAWRESAGTPPNLYFLDAATRSARPLTRLRDPAPAFAGMTSIPLRYERADGVALSATLYLPAAVAGDNARPLPTLFWAYPVFRDEAPVPLATAGPGNRFVRPRGFDPLLLTADGYAVLVATMPVVETADGPGFVEQIVGNSRAAIAAAADTGWVDPERVAAAGHSFGAGMVANLLAHSDLFASGIALSGAYNRTLTPFGFQTERRTLWDAEEKYLALSPLLQADQIEEPLLLVHGLADPNSGTLPMQSERLFAALRGLGKPARLVLLPAEGHQYTARESVLHVLWEMENWLARTL